MINVVVSFMICCFNVIDTPVVLYYVIILLSEITILMKTDKSKILST